MRRHKAVPLKQALDVADVHELGVVVGKNVGDVLEENFFAGLGIRRGVVLCLLVHTAEELRQWLRFAVVGVHGHAFQGGKLVLTLRREAPLAVAKVFYDQTAFAFGDDFVQTGESGNGDDFAEFHSSEILRKSTDWNVGLLVFWAPHVVGRASR
jgi:hypothetical protein